MPESRSASRWGDLRRARSRCATSHQKGKTYRGLRSWPSSGPPSCDTGQRQDCKHPPPPRASGQSEVPNRWPGTSSGLVSGNWEKSLGGRARRGRGTLADFTLQSRRGGRRTNISEQLASMQVHHFSSSAGTGDGHFEELVEWNAEWKTPQARPASGTPPGGPRNPISTFTFFFLHAPARLGRAADQGPGEGGDVCILKKHIY